jgi:DNA-binding response OmpR family regulator
MSKKILLIEDDIFIREMYEYVLKKKQYTVVTALDGTQALEQAQTKPDLILLDIMLPKIHGIDVLKKLKSEKITQNIPVIMITNLADKEIIEHTFQLGAQGYILKVRFDPEEVCATIKIFLDDPHFQMKLEPHHL